MRDGCLVLSGRQVAMLEPHQRRTARAKVKAGDDLRVKAFSVDLYDIDRPGRLPEHVIERDRRHVRTHDSACRLEILTEVALLIGPDRALLL